MNSERDEEELLEDSRGFTETIGRMLRKSMLESLKNTSPFFSEAVLRQGSRVRTPEGPGKVVQLSTDQWVIVEFEASPLTVFADDELELL